MAKDVEDNIQFVKMCSIGVYIFKVIKFYNAKQESRMFKGKENKYYMRPMKVKAYHFNNIDLVDDVLKTAITENIYTAMAKVVCLMKKHEIIKTYDDINNYYFIYYKRNKMTNNFSFMNQEMYDKFGDIIKAGNISEIDKKICWSGVRNHRRGELLKYYGSEKE